MAGLHTLTVFKDMNLMLNQQENNHYFHLKVILKIHLNVILLIELNNYEYNKDINIHDSKVPSLLDCSFIMHPLFNKPI